METSEGGTKSPDPEPKIIGLTGGIGSGKSTVASFIKKLGYPVYNSDSRAKELVNESSELRNEIILLLGEKSYNQEGLYDRKHVAKLVFDNDELLNSLNKIIHPAVRKDFTNWVLRQTLPYVFKESALLFELGLDKECHRVILVTAEDNIRTKRVMDRDQKTYREVEKIMDSQMPEKEKIRKTSLIIFNNHGLEELEVETERVLEKLIHSEQSVV